MKKLVKSILHWLLATFVVAFVVFLGIAGYTIYLFVIS